MLVLNRTRPSPPRKSSLSLARQRLLELMQSIGYGWVHNIIVRNGDPDLDDPVQASFRLRTDRPMALPRAAQLEDYVLRDQQVSLMHLLTRVQTGQIKRILVLNGLPSELDKVEVLAA